MHIQTTAHVVIGELVHPVEIEGEAFDIGDTIETHLDQVRGLPLYMERADLHPEQEEVLHLALEDAFVRRERVQKRLASDLAQVVSELRRAMSFEPESTSAEVRTYQRIGALENTLERVAARLESIKEEVA